MEILDQYSVDGLSFEVIYNEADSIMETLGEVLNTLITGIILTMLVLFLFFGDLRASLIVGISMPLSILLAVILLNFAGFAIDLMTGTSLIIAIGMIVDNSIVILESCMRSRENGLDFREAAVEGRKRTYAITERGRALFRQELSRLRLCVADGEREELASERLLPGMREEAP